MTLFNFIAIVSAVLVLIVCGVIILDNRSPSRTIAWLLILILLPLAGLFLYIYIGQNHKKKKTFIKKSKKDYQVTRQLLKEQASFTEYQNYFVENFEDMRGQMIPLLLNNTHSPFTVNNKIEVLQNGERAFSSILRAIREAKHHIHVEFFIIKDSQIGRDFQQALIQKAQEGLQVRLMYDAVGSWQLKSSYLTPMREAGVEIYPFLPVSIPFFGERLNYRNHRKIIVVDGRIGFLGGLNIGDEYLGKSPKLGFWRDTHLKVEGESVYVLQTIFLMDWFFVSGEELDDKVYFPRQGYCGETLMQIAASGPDSHWESIQQAYFTAISAARERVYITTPYLVPDESILMALKTAALRGVDVRILLPSKPDHRTVFWASKSHFVELMMAGVRIYQYNKGFVHSKVIVADRIFTSIGTANLDIRSFSLNFEVNAFLYDQEINRKLAADFMEDLKSSTQVILDEYKKRPVSDKLKESLARLLSPVL